MIQGHKSPFILLFVFIKMSLLLGLYNIPVSFFVITAEKFYNCTVKWIKLICFLTVFQMLMVWATATVGSTLSLPDHSKIGLKQQEPLHAIMLVDPWMSEEVEEEESENHYEPFTLLVYSGTHHASTFKALSRLLVDSAFKNSTNCPLYLFSGKLLI